MTRATHHIGRRLPLAILAVGTALLAGDAAKAQGTGECAMVTLENRTSRPVVFSAGWAGRPEQEYRIEPGGRRSFWSFYPPGQRSSPGFYVRYRYSSGANPSRALAYEVDRFHSPTAQTDRFAAHYAFEWRGTDLVLLSENGGRMQIVQGGRSPGSGPVPVYENPTFPNMPLPPGVPSSVEELEHRLPKIKF